MRQIPDDSKTLLCKKLQAAEACSRRLRKCLLCQLDGIGRYDQSAVNGAHEEYLGALEEAAAITGDELPEAGLFSSGYAQEVER